MDFPCGRAALTPKTRGKGSSSGSEFYILNAFIKQGAQKVFYPRPVEVLGGRKKDLLMNWIKELQEKELLGQGLTQERGSSAAAPEKGKHPFSSYRE